MTAIDFYWRIPTHGDKGALHQALTRGDWTETVPGSLAPGLRHGLLDEFSYVDHMADIARAAEISGFYGALLPSFPQTDDPWVISSAIARETTTLRFMIAFQPGFLNPVAAARLSASLQRVSGGRVVYNIISGGGGPAQLWWGDAIDHDDRYRRTTEFLDVHKGVWKEAPFTYDGTFYQVSSAALPAALAREDLPRSTSRGRRTPRWPRPAATPTTTCRGSSPSTSSRPSSTRSARRRPGTAGRPASPSGSTWWPGPPRRRPGPEIRRGWETVDERQLQAMYGHLRGDGDSVGGARQVLFRPEGARGYEDLIVAPNIWSGFSQLRAVRASASWATTPTPPSGWTTSSGWGWTPSSWPACPT